MSNRLGSLCPLFRWLLGLLFASLPRRFIARRFRDVLSSGADQPFPYPVGKADAQRVRGFSNQRIVLWHQPDSQGGGMRTGLFFPWSRHDSEL